MRYFLFLLLAFSLYSPGTSAQRNKKKPQPLGEEILIHKLISALQSKDAYAYQELFPEADTVTKLMTIYADSSSSTFSDAAWLQNNPAEIMRADSAYNAALRASFEQLQKRGEDEYNILWNNVTLLRYELKKARTTRDALYEKLAPTRFYGYIFIRDNSSRKVYALSAGDIMEIRGNWYGGHLKHIIKASTVDEYEEGLAEWQKKKRIEAMSPKYERRPGPEDSVGVVVLAEGDIPVDTLENTPTKKDVAVRTFYAGMFDEEIPVQLYIRTLRGGCADGSDGNCLYDAIYRFGDQDEYIKLEVQHRSDGKWELTEDPPAGAMELELKDGKLVGTWTSADGDTGYDVKLSEVPASDKKIKRLDEIMLNEEWMK